MKEHAFLLVPALTVALAIVFLVPDNSGTKTSYESLGGKAWSMMRPVVPAVVTTAASVSVSTAPTSAPKTAAPALITKQPPQPAKGIAKRSRRTAQTKRALAAQVAPLDQTHLDLNLRPAVSSSVAPSGVVPVPVGSVSNQEYVLEDVADRFESDESKFPLDRSADAGGVALRLIGLEKLPAMFVLKIAVVNSADADFFVKGFAIEAGNQFLLNRSSFRILVEPKRTREGYVLFERPPAGSSVHIKLKEDGGKGRALELAIPYPF